VPSLDLVALAEGGNQRLTWWPWQKVVAVGAGAVAALVALAEGGSRRSWCRRWTWWLLQKEGTSG